MQSGVHGNIVSDGILLVTLDDGTEVKYRGAVLCE
jgi:hypothetical protein